MRCGIAVWILILLLIGLIILTKQGLYKTIIWAIVTIAIIVLVLLKLCTISLFLLIIVLMALLTLLVIKNRERIAEKIYEMRLKKEVIVKKDIRGVMLNKLSKLERTINRKTREELTKDVSNTFKELIKAALQIDYEFTHEELVTELDKLKIDHELKKIIESFSEDMSKLKYSGYRLTKEEARSLLNEMKIITELSTKEPEEDSEKEK
jgi:cell division protein FtsW (lipid II flippase)